jgi:molecular chaperone GrpE (heat shock protein)
MTRARICVLLLSLAVACPAASNQPKKHLRTEAHKTSAAKDNSAVKDTPSATDPAETSPVPPADTDETQTRTTPPDPGAPVSSQAPMPLLELAAAVFCLVLSSVGVVVSLLAARRAEACGRALHAEHGTAAASFQTTDQRFARDAARMDSIEAALDTLSRRFEHRIQAEVDSIRRDYTSNADFSSAAAMLSADLDRVAEGVLDEVRRTAALVQQNTRVATEKVAQVAERHEVRLQALESSAGSQLSALLHSLAGASVDFSGVQLGAAAEAAQGAVSAYLQAAGPSVPAECKTLFESAESLERSLRDFQGAVRFANAATGAKINLLVNAAGDLRQEIGGLIAESADRKARLHFSVDFSTLRSSREALTAAIAAGLKDAILRLDEPAVHFRRRFDQLASAACMTAADVADKDADPERSAEKVQQALAGIFRSAGLTDIAPQRGQDYRVEEHEVLQFVPGRSERTQAVARTVSRGFRRDGQVLRRALVMLYE